MFASEKKVNGPVQVAVPAETGNPPKASLEGGIGGGEEDLGDPQGEPHDTDPPRFGQPSVLQHGPLKLGWLRRLHRERGRVPSIQGFQEQDRGPGPGERPNESQEDGMMAARSGDAVEDHPAREWG